MSEPPPRRITEVAFAKNEGRFLLEWIAYHRLIGVSDFLVYTNDCEDESPPSFPLCTSFPIVVWMASMKQIGFSSRQLLYRSFPNTLKPSPEQRSSPCRR